MWCPLLYKQTGVRLASWKRYLPALPRNRVYFALHHRHQAKGQPVDSVSQSASQQVSHQSHWDTITTDRGHNWIILWYEYFGNGGATMYPHLLTGNNDKNLHNSLVNFKTKEMRNGHHNGAAVSILWGLSLYKHNVCMCMSWRAAEHRRLGGRTAGRKGKSERSRVFSWRSYILLLKYFPSVASLCLSIRDGELPPPLSSPTIRSYSKQPWRILIIINKQEEWNDLQVGRNNCGRPRESKFLGKFLAGLLIIVQWMVW